MARWEEAVTRGRGLAAALLVAAVGPADLAAQSYQTTTQARRLEDNAPLTVNVTYAAGQFRFGPGEAKQLYRVSMTYDENRFDPTIAYRKAEGILDVNIAGRGHVNGKDFDSSRQRLDLAVNPQTLVDLALKFGAAQAEIELGGLSLRSAHIETGASQTTVTFGAPNRVACSDLSFKVGAAQFEVEKLGNSRCSAISLEGGVGQMVLDFAGDWPAGQDNRVTVSIGMGDVQLHIPKGLGVRLEVDRFLAAVDRAGFVKRGAAYYTPDYDAAPVKIALDVSAVLGNIDVTWTR
jgi:hypothetical protein